MLIIQYKAPPFIPACTGQTPYGWNPCPSDPDIILSNNNYDATGGGGIDIVRSYTPLPRPGIEAPGDVYVAEFTIVSSNGLHYTRSLVGLVTEPTNLLGGDRIGTLYSSIGAEIQSQYATAASRARSSLGNSGAQIPQLATGDVIGFELRESTTPDVFRAAFFKNGAYMSIHTFPDTEPVYLAASIYVGDTIHVNEGQDPFIYN